MGAACCTKVQAGPERGLEDGGTSRVCSSTHPKICAATILSACVLVMFSMCPATSNSENDCIFPRSHCHVPGDLPNPRFSTYGLCDFGEAILPLSFPRQIIILTLKNGQGTGYSMYEHPVQWLVGVHNYLPSPTLLSLLWHLLSQCRCLHGLFL